MFYNVFVPNSGNEPRDASGTISDVISILITYDGLEYRTMEQASTIASSWPISYLCVGTEPRLCIEAHYRRIPFSGRLRTEGNKFRKNQTCTWSAACSVLSCEAKNIEIHN